MSCTGKPCGGGHDARWRICVLAPSLTHSCCLLWLVGWSLRFIFIGRGPSASPVSTVFSTRGLGTGWRSLAYQQCSRQSGLATGWQYVTAHTTVHYGHSPCSSVGDRSDCCAIPWPWLSYPPPKLLLLATADDFCFTTPHSTFHLAASLIGAVGHAVGVSNTYYHQ